MTSFKGVGILCFYNNGLFQGHLIDKTTNDSPFTLAGKLLPDHVDPKHNDCMEADNFYKVLLKSHSTKEDISLLLRRSKGNDASGIFSHEHEAEINDGYEFSFVTHHFLTGKEASTLQEKYFSRYNQIDTDVTVCIGDIQLVKHE